MADTTNKQQEFTSSIKIADDVISSIAELAAADVDGVAAMAVNTTNDLISILGRKPINRGVRAVVENDEVTFTLSIVVKYGSNIPRVCRNVQDKVRTTVENMTGFKTGEVNVTISGISLPENT